MPTEGQNLQDHVAEKYGTTKAQSADSRVRMTEVGAEVGFEFHFAGDMRMHNTFNVHQLLHWANQQERTHDLKQALFTAHFTHGRNLSDDSVLADVAAEIGLDRSEALAVLEDQRFAADVRAAEKVWLDEGIQGVPAMIFNNRHLITGAQGVENYSRVLQELTKENS
jgi:predicted DsbA family dithiol-disulfide isomerase